MNTLEKLKNDKYLVWALLFALFNMGAIFLIFGFQKYGDSPQYIEIIDWFRGENAQVTPWRILKPLGPLIAVPFEFLGEGAGLILQNIIFYLLSAFLMFKITELIYQSKKQAFFASIFFVTATPIIEVGLAYLTDAGGWFFYLLSIFLTLLYFKNRNKKLIITNGFLSGLGVLMKETAGLGFLFFGLMILFTRDFGIKEKILKIARFGIFFLIPIVIIQTLVFKYYQVTYWDWYLIGGTVSYGEGLLLISFRYLGQFFRILGIIWPLVLIGIWRELREKNWERIKILLALIPPSFSFLLWTFAAGGRVAFIFAPLGIILATYGLVFFCNKLDKKRGALMAGLLLVLVIVFNYWFCLVNQKIPFIDIIYTSIFSR